MKLYTSYWAQVRNFPKNLIGLSTVQYPPKWRKFGQDKRGVWVIDCPPLKPGKECEGLCNGKCMPAHPEDCAFLQAYSNQLCKLDFTDFIQHLEKLKLRFCAGEVLDDVDFAFIFFEPPTKSCSERIPLTNWMRENGIEVEEWQKANS